MDLMAGSLLAVEGEAGLHMPAGIVAFIKWMLDSQQYEVFAYGDNAKDPATRAAAAVEIFGREGMEVLPMLAGLKDRMAEVGEAALVSQEKLKKTKRYDRASGWPTRPKKRPAIRWPAAWVPTKVSAPDSNAPKGPFSAARGAGVPAPATTGKRARTSKTGRPTMR